jgi:uncharacterized membrane protein SpoIIM required for sporulation
MKETRFIAQNKEKWLESETLLQSQVKDPEKLSNLFTQIVDDLSFSRTYYPNRSIRVYLNKIARQYFSIIYSHHKERKNTFKLFWLDELPQIIIYSRKQLLIALVVFLFSVAIGIFSSLKDPDFVGSILGKEYVTMTKENIDKGDPMAVYKNSSEGNMFLVITLNNLRVAFQTYVFGIFMAIGTLAVLLYNGIMVGSFQFFFIERGLFWESATTIWLHGTLEMSAIVLAGGAGLVLGSGLIFPGTYSRLQAFQISAIRSLKLMLGIAPIIVMAAIIESFLTRYTDAPDVLKLTLIILSAAFIIGYFVVYPWMKSKKGFEVPLKETKLPPSMLEPVSYVRLKNNAEIIKDTFLFYTRNANGLFPWIVVAALGATVATYAFDPEPVYLLEDTNWLAQIFQNMVFGLKTSSPWFILSNTIFTSIVLYRTMQIIDNESKKTKSRRWKIQAFIQLNILVAVIFASIYLGAWGIFLIFFFFLLLLVIGFTQLTEEAGLMYGISKGWSMFWGNSRQAFELKAIVALLAMSFLAVLSAPFFYIFTQALSWNFAESDTWARTVISFIETFIKIFSLYLVIPILGAATSYLYFTLEEIDSATNLKLAIERMGTRNQKGKKK